MPNHVHLSFPIPSGALPGGPTEPRPEGAVSLRTDYGLQLRKPVTDATGLQGKYDIAMFWARDDALRAAPDPGGVAVAADPAPTLMEALQDQLGLQLESKKGPVEFVVVDHAEKAPTEN